MLQIVASISPSSYWRKCAIYVAIRTNIVEISLLGVRPGRDVIADRLQKLFLVPQPGRLTNATDVSHIDVRHLDEWGFEGYGTIGKTFPMSRPRLNSNSPRVCRPLSNS